MKEKILLVTNAKKETGVHYTLNHTGKMAGMMSLSTSCLCNPHCQAYSKNPEAICSHCYANTLLKVRTVMQPCLQKNAEILSNKVLKREEIPLINATYFRFEAFGDLINETHVINYFNICKANKHVKFALWTKNPHIIQHVLDSGVKKPSNLQIVLSSFYVNKPADKERWDFVDKVFTVYDKNYISEHNIDINCGARSCLACNKCYRKTKEVYINEKLK